MPSTFFGLTIASSGLNTYQAAANTVANNISNVQTAGYSRQVTNRVASAALRVNAKYGSAGTGVTTDSITQLRDSYYDTKYWNNNASVGMYSTLETYSKQIENYFIDDDTTKGFSSILNTMFGYMETLKTDSSDSSVRNQFISGAQSLATYFNSASTGLSSIQEDTNSQVKAAVDNINSIAEKISILNKQINVIEIQGGYANELRDQRALLIDELSAIVPTTTKEVMVSNSNNPDYLTGATEYTVKINGQTIVSGEEYSQLACRARTTKVNQTDADGLYDVIWADTGNTFNASSANNNGSLKALLDIRDGNNAEYFNGTVSEIGSTTVEGATVSTLTISDPSMLTEIELTIPGEGKLNINNASYGYTSFTANYDADGNIESYTFVLDQELDAATSARVDNSVASVGSSVDYMGIPYYQAQLNEFLRSFAQAFNDLEKSGSYIDSDGETQKMGAFFVAFNRTTQTELDFNDTELSSESNSYYQLTAANVAVASASMKNPTIFATSTSPENGVEAFDIVDSLLKLKSDREFYRGCGASDFLQCMISDVSVDTAQAKLFNSNSTAMSATITNQRLSVSGVDEDEEALDLVKFQNAYNLSSKLVSVLSEMYNRLILETGV